MKKNLIIFAVIVIIGIGIYFLINNQRNNTDLSQNQNKENPANQNQDNNHADGTQTEEQENPDATTYTLTVTKSLAAGGTITSSPAGIDCGNTCSYSFNTNSSVTLTAAATTGYVFSNWSGCTSANGNICTVTMNNSKTVTATFKTVTDTSAPKTTDNFTYGNFIINPPSIAPGQSSSVSVEVTNTSSTERNLTVWLTGSWTLSKSILLGAGIKTTIFFTVTPNSSTSLGVHPIQIRQASQNGTIVSQGTLTLVSVPTTFYTLTVNKSPAGGGTITSSSAGIDCGNTCSTASANLASGTSIILTAIPITGCTFTGWTGACTGNGTCTLSMNSNKIVGAGFNCPRTYTLTIYTAGSGTVTKTPDQTTYIDGQIVTLTANAGTKYNFSNWSFDLSGSANPTTITINNNKSVMATFIYVP